MTKTLVATAKNEGPYFLEWVAYHRMIGFDNILIFQNDSDDLTHEALTILEEVGQVKYFYNRAGAGRHQVKAYRRAARQPEFRSADWVMALDMDEFLNVRTGDGTLDALLAAMPDADEILINWRRFGNGGHDHIDEQLVVEKFLSAESDSRITEWLTPFKTLFRPSHYTRCGVHQARDPLVPPDQITTVNGSGLHKEEFEHQRFRTKDPKCRSLAQVNHYITRDTASFVLKSDKGSAHQANREIGRNYWHRRNFNQDKDIALAGLTADIQSAMSKIDTLSGGRLSALREKSILHHQQRFKSLLNQPKYRDLYEICAAS